MGLVNQAQTQASADPAAGPNPTAQQPEPMAPMSSPNPAQAEGEGEDLTNEEQSAYNSAMEMVAEVIYGNDKSSQAVMKQLRPDDPVTSVAEVTTLLIDQVEQAFNGKVPESIVIPLADETSDLLLELISEGTDAEIDQNTYTKVKGAVTKELGAAYGVQEGDMEGMLQGVTSDEVTAMKGMFEEPQQ